MCVYMGVGECEYYVLHVCIYNEYNYLDRKNVHVLGGKKMDYMYMYMYTCTCVY